MQGAGALVTVWPLVRSLNALAAWAASSPMIATGKWVLWSWFSDMSTTSACSDRQQRAAVSVRVAAAAGKGHLGMRAGRGMPAVCFLSSLAMAVWPSREHQNAREGHV